MTNQSAERDLATRFAPDELREASPQSEEQQAKRMPRGASVALAYTGTLLVTLSVAVYLFFGNTLIAFLRDDVTDLWLRPLALVLIASALAGLFRFLKSLPYPSMPVSLGGLIGVLRP
ncbi:hypothetical protein [Rhizobium oryzicola]|uniref:Tripartite tricarboxylate transporter TctB family protein n=1 Tax=Rhizobium oryzicola TaxID=1232668 RepID=A0ABT8SUF6_9HYPH|nr:hypothetical protein [Rhizobium oryzicola]MDO1581377.1 hypothetical protein [Rhizobium oryzicola]